MALTTVPASLSATAITLTTAAQPNITSVGTLTGLTVSGNIAGTLTTAAQTNITSLGTLSALTVTGTSTLGVVDASSFTDVITNTIYTQSSSLDIDTVLTGRDVTFTQGSTNLMIVKGDASGVGIGVSSLTEKLEVSGSINATNQSANFATGAQRGFLDMVNASKHVRIGSLTGAATATGTQGTVEIVVNNSARVVVDENGDVGIGVTSPQVALHIRGSAVSGASFATEDGITLEQPGVGGSNINIISTSSTQGGILFSDGDTRAEGRINYIHSNDYMQFYTNSAERMRINSSGNVIINQPSFSSLPTGSKLNIFGDGTTLRLDGSSATTKSILFRNVNAGNPGEVYADGSLRLRTEDASTFISFHTNSSGTNNERMRISDGTGTGYTLKVNGNIDVAQLKGSLGNAFLRFTDGDASADWSIGSDDGSGAGAGAFIIYDRSQSAYRAVINSSGNVGIGETVPDRRLHVKSGANSADGVFRIESANNNIMDMGTDGTGHFINCVNTDPFRVQFAGTEKFRIDNAGTVRVATGGNIDFNGGGGIKAANVELLRFDTTASAGYASFGGFGITGTNSMVNIHGGSNDAALVVSNTNLHSATAYGWAGRGGRYLTSNGTNWAADGKDPAIVVGSSTPNAYRGNGIGIILHNENNTDNHFGPIVGWGAKSTSNSYNSMYAYIVGKKTGTGVDTNWHRGELQFDTAGLKPGQTQPYFNDKPAMTITENAAVLMPYQPSFKIAWSTRNATGSNRFLSSNAGDSQYTGRDSHNTGNHFDVATGKFTCPVAGTYFFGFHGMRNGTNGSYLECRLKKNNSLMWARAYQAAFDQAHQYWAITTISDCAVGDYIQVMIGPNTSIYYDDTYFYGYLIG